MSLFTRSLWPQRNKDKQQTGKGTNPGTGPSTTAPQDEAADGGGPKDGGSATDGDSSKGAGSATDTGTGEDSGETAAGPQDAADTAGGAEDGNADAAGADAAEAGPGTEDGDGAPRYDRRTAARRIASTATTVLATALVLGALMLPNAMQRLSLNAFLRIPVEAIFGTVVLLVLAPRARRWTALLSGTALGLVTILKFLDMGFYSVLARPFDLVLDWILFDDAHSFLKDSVGQTGAVLALVGIVVLALALVVLMALSVRRLSRIMAGHRTVTTRAVLAVGTAWTLCAVFGLHTGKDEVDVASRSTAILVQNRVEAVRAGMADAEAFEKVARVDKFDETPGEKIVPDLRGKNVIFAFVESYGRSAIEDPGMAPGVNKVLAERTDALDEAGYSSRSGWLTSPISGAGSWMGHSTLLSGLWVANEQRYRSVTSSDRLTVTRAFRKTGDYRMVGIMPGVRRSWPEGKFYGMDHVYDSRELGYEGPYFSWSPVPDQFTLKAFERLEHGKAKADDRPLMATVILASSHNPWSPLPRMLPWDKLGDGSVYKPIHDAGARPTEVWKDPERVRAQYRKAIQYSVRSLTEYVEKYGDDDTVLVFLGDHQPVPTVTNGWKNKDVPISIVARDEKVLEKVSDWGWDEGLKPGKDAPVWRMDKFRDRFLTAYGSEPDTGPKPGGGSG